MNREVEIVVQGALTSAFNSIVQLDHNKRAELDKLFGNFDADVKAVFGVKPAKPVAPNPDVDNDGDVDETDLSIVHKEYAKQKTPAKKKTTKKTTKKVNK